MIDVGMRKDDDIDGFRIEAREAAVDFISILAVALIKSAIEKDALAVDFE